MLHEFSKQGRNVAILVHEFPDTSVSYSSGGCGNSKVTITLNGIATIQVRRGTPGKGGRRQGALTSRVAVREKGLDFVSIEAIDTASRDVLFAVYIGRFAQFGARASIVHAAGAVRHLFLLTRGDAVFFFPVLPSSLR